jgi:hypothetical protein
MKRFAVSSLAALLLLALLVVTPSSVVSAVGDDSAQTYSSTPYGTGDGSCVLILNPGTPNSVMMPGDAFTIRCVFFGFEGPTTATPMNFRLNSFGTSSNDSVVLTASTSGSRYATLARGSGAGVWGGECASCFEWSGAIVQTPSVTTQWGAAGIVDNGYTGTTAYFVEHGWIAAGGGGHMAVSSSADAIPPRNGTNGVVLYNSPAPANPCSAPGSVVFEVDGQTVEQVDEQGTTLSTLSDNLVALSFASADYGSRAIGDGLSYRTTAGASWLAVGGGVVVGGTTLIVFEPYVDGVRSLSNFEIRCKWEGVTKYWSLSNLGAPVWSDSARSDRACKGLNVINGEGRFEVGDLVQLAYDFPAGSYTGGDAGLNDLEVMTGGNLSGPGDGGRQVIEGAYGLFGNQIGGIGAPWSYVVPVDTKGTLRFVATFSADRSALFVQCVDSDGLQLVVGGGVSWTPYATGGGSQDPNGSIIGRPANWLTPSECLPASGIGVSPSSWLPGAGAMTMCLVKTLVSPGEFNSAAWNARINDTSLNQWGTPVATFTGGLTDLATSTGECDPVYDMPAPIPDLTLDMCSGPIAAARTISFTLSTLAIGLWIGRLSLRKMETFVAGQPS